MTYQSFFTESLLTELKTQNTTVNTEVEVRFGSWLKGKFEPGVEWAKFRKALEFFIAQGYKPKQSSTIEYRDAQYRKIIDHNNKVEWQSKISGINDKRDNKEYNFRISWAKEQTLSQEEVTRIQPDFEKRIQKGEISVRQKNRYSFDVSFGANKLDKYKLDFTTVSSTEHKSAKTSYEIELELAPNNLNSVMILSAAIQNLFKIIYNTNTIYSNTEKDSVISLLRSLDPKGNIKNILVKARNIKYRDLVYGGLVGNKDTSYNVAWKADGIRKMLVVDNKGIWLIFPPLEYDLVYTHAQTNNKYINYIGTIFDGELVPHNKLKIDFMTKNLNTKALPRGMRFYYVFDCLTDSKQDLRTKYYSERLTAARELSGLLKYNVENPNALNMLHVSLKTTRNINTVDKLFSVINDFKAKEAELEYMQDGFIFTPENTEYNPHSERLPLYKRKLTQVPDVCKWKPPERLTIDFKLMHIPNSIRLATGFYNTRTNSYEDKIFMGDDRTALDYKTMVDPKDAKIQSLDTGAIVEYGWDYKTKMLVPHGVRTDKINPNEQQIAIDVWQDIHDPITEGVLKGERLDLVFKYHNRIKRELFNNLSDGYILLDIGSGRGGDISKWLKAKHVYAVEPNKDNLKELYSRLKFYKKEDQVTIIEAGGQDSETIKTALKGTKVDVISLMLSLTFFWSSEDMLLNLVQTIIDNLKPGGRIIFLTADGDAIEQMFRPVFGGLTETTLYFGGVDNNKIVTMNYDPDKSNKVFINIKDSIVTDQIEYLARITDLEILLKEYGFRLEFIKRADKELLLSQDELRYSRLYSYGSFVNDKTEKFDTKIEAKEMRRRLTTVPNKNLSPLPEEKTSDKTSPPKTEEKVRDTKTSPPKTGEPAREVAYLKRTDEIKPITSTWFNDLYRIQAIDDGNCFIHAVLKAYYKPYQEATETQRKEMATVLRRDLGQYLKAPSDQYQGFTEWEVASRGAFVDRLARELMHPELIYNSYGGVAYDIVCLAKFLNSDRFLGEEIYQYISDRLGIGVVTCSINSKDLTPIFISSGQFLYWVVICGNPVHYEIVAIKTEQGYQTFYTEDDDLIVQIKLRSTPDNTDFKPQQHFIDSVAAAFTDDFTHIFIEPDMSGLSQDDPFRKRYQLNKTEITNLANGLYEAKNPTR